ncbi:MAG: DUF308 domain-containing protein, partial [Anaerolineae bacterium]|nr:DUF308 domain-containing protein [Anaerolineae bacterium]
MSLDQSQDTGVEVPRMPLIIWGILVAVAGFFLLTRPAITAIAWVEIMAITWLIGGIFELIQALTDRGRYWGWRVISAILSVVAGIYIIGNPVIGTLFTVQVAFIFFAISALMDSIISI